MWYHGSHSVILLVSCAILSSCASLSGVQERYAVCTYDHVWDAALDAVKDRSVTVKDKHRGLIETAWVEIPMPGRSFGVLRRDVPDSKDRSRLFLTVKRVDVEPATEEVIRVTYAEERQSWVFRGGSRLFGWAETDPSEEVRHDVQNRLNAKMKEHGCSLT
ncbi:MAG: hypothetical protein HZB34_17200 [Nitrospirae bacterium]|nr:hypothetical protein [Nitrospirota bacterium]